MKNIIITLLATFLYVGCSTGADKPKHEIGNAETSGQKNLICFKVNGKQVKTSGWNISRFKQNNSPDVCLNITTNMNEEKQAINVNLGGSQPGTYSFDANQTSKPTSYGSFFPDYAGDMTNSFSFIDGSFTITDMDTVAGMVNGNFHGTVKNLRGERLEISDGHIINAFLKAGIRGY